MQMLLHWHVPSGGAGRPYGKVNSFATESKHFPKEEITFYGDYVLYLLYNDLTTKSFVQKKDT